MSWKRKIAGCFGVKDQKFAVHPADEKRARELRAELLDQGVEWSDVEAAFRAHLESKAPQNQQHQDEQMERVRKFMKPLIDG